MNKNRATRRQTVTVHVGAVTIGSNDPIRIQSMANTDTMDTEASAQQAKRIADRGGEIVRFTAQGRSQAENLTAIKTHMHELGCDVPLVADIHFNPNAAFEAAARVEKVRINPGNFIDKRADFTHLYYTEAEYAAELDRLRERLNQLLDICREHGTALRIGVNHGSLSDRIMSRYGDTPQGMVESAMEFLRVCQGSNFDNVVISMKSSNVRVMVQAYRLLVETMDQNQMHYPLHLGVTEAGDGEDGRIKSALGIGTLLSEGIGDTIRVSLTEDPENEIDVARKLIAHITNTPIRPTEKLFTDFDIQRRPSDAVGIVGALNVPVVVCSACDAADFDAVPESWERVTDSSQMPKTKGVVLLSVNGAERDFFAQMKHDGLTNPVVIHRKYNENDLETLQIKASCDLGSLLLDGYADGIWIENEGNITAAEICSLSFGILQAARLRTTKTEYIACPGCGRTLFDLQSTLAAVRARTSHLKGLKIGVMGCIVNGPGEMADADYGYVGAGAGRVTLYRGKQVVMRDIAQEQAIERLVDLIKSDGNWVEPT